MFKQQVRFFLKFVKIADLFFLFLALFLVYFVRNHLQASPRPFHDYLWILLAVLPIWFFLLTRNGFYTSLRKVSTFENVYRLLNVHLQGGAVVAALIYFVDRNSFSREFYLAFLGSSFVLLALEKLALGWSLDWMSRRGYYYKNIIIVGTREKAERFNELLEGHVDWGLKILGFVQVIEQPSLGEFHGHRVLGRVHDLVEICKQHPVDEVVFCLPKDYVIDAEEYLKDLEELGITVCMLLDFFEVKCSRQSLSFFQDSLPMLTFHSRSLKSGQLFIKRILDIFGALTGLAILAVLFPFIAFAIKKNSPGPIFFGQERVGMSGRTFKCWKFRSMYIDAEERKKELMAQNEMKGAIFKIKDDPRITSVGNFLRKTSLDELPQFWNVLRGEMSLVGTRPPTLGEVAEYENWHRRRISIRPGITGIWQVSGRNQIDDFDEIVRLDLQYIDNWSLWLDIRILFKTFVVVFAREGSC